MPPCPLRRQALARAQPRVRPHVLPEQHRTSPGLLPRPDPRQPCGSNRRSIRLIPRRSPARRGPRRAAAGRSAGREDARSPVPTPRSWEMPCGLQPARASAASMSCAISRSVRPAATQVPSARPTSDVARHAARTRSTSNASLIARNSSTHWYVGTNAREGMARRHASSVATVTDSASQAHAVSCCSAATWASVVSKRLSTRRISIPAIAPAARASRAACSYLPSTSSQVEAEVAMSRAVPSNPVRYLMLIGEDTMSAGAEEPRSDFHSRRSRPDQSGRRESPMLRRLILPSVALCALAPS